MNLLQAAWRWLVAAYRRVFARQARAPESPQLAPLSPLEAENYFMQLLDGVADGWDRVKVDRFFAALQGRSSQDDWLRWLYEFGERLLESDEPHSELGRRLRQLAQVEGGHLGKLAQVIGDRVLERSETVRKTQAVAATVQAHTREAENSPLEPRISPPREEDFYRNGTTDKKARVEPILSLPEDAPDSETIDPEALWQQGVKALDTGDEKEAARCWQASLFANPQNGEGWSKLGELYQRLGRYEEAIAANDNAIALLGGRPSFPASESQPKEPESAIDAVFPLERVEEENSATRE